MTSIEEISMIIKSTDLEFIIGLMVENMKENGKIINFTAKENLVG